MSEEILPTADDGLDWQEGDMPYARQFSDHFYCRSDGRLEGGHVFLAGNGWPQRSDTSATFRIGEQGFRTGLNSPETGLLCNLVRARGPSLRYTSFTFYPHN